MNPPATSSKILIVEDELVVAADLEDHLRDLGFEIVGTAGTAEQALALAARERPELILMDIQLQGKSEGIETADAIRRKWDIPVVFLTAYTNEDIMRKARAAGAYGFLSKPFRVEDLKATILIALQQHRLGKELFAEHNWLTTMLASLSDGVIAADASGCVRYVNPAAEILTNWSSQEAVGKAIEEVYPLTHMDGSEVLQCHLRRALEARSPIPKEWFLMKVRDGHYLPVEDSAAPIIEEGHLLGAVTIFLDITDRLEAEARQQAEQGRLKEEVKTTSVALGHSQEELRALSGRLLTAQEDERRRVARELHDDLGQRTALMGWRIAELSKLSDKIPANAQTEIDSLREDLNYIATGLREVSHRLHPAATVDLGLVTALTELVYQQRAQGTDVSLIARELPEKMSIEISTALYRIAQEALRNAVQHAPECPISIKVSVDSNAVELRIEDPGPGFDMQSARQSGGLGLLSMQERARILGGTFDVKAVLNEGTSVTVSIPLAKVSR